MTMAMQTPRMSMLRCRSLRCCCLRSCSATARRWFSRSFFLATRPSLGRSRRVYGWVGGGRRGVRTVLLLVLRLRGMPKQPEGGASGRARAREITKAQAAREKRRRLLWQLGAFVTVAVVVVLVTVAVLAGRGGSSETVEGAPAGVSKDGGIFVGAEDAPVTLTMVEDFQCPVCRDFEAANKTLLDTYAAGSDVRL